VVRGDFLSRLLHRGDISIGLVLLGMAVAFGLGSMHALSPGHGKTIVAAYLVGSRGTIRQAVFLGGMVTFTHTISVFFLGLTTLFLSQYVLPEKIFPVLGAISGLSIVWIGGMMLYKRAQKLRHLEDHEHHHHDHGHDHTHGHHHGPGGHSHVPEGDVTLGSLIALGASGGLVPCPSALVLLLSSIALGRVGLGLLLLIAFSSGLALVLMGIGIVVLYAKHLLPDSQKAAAHPAFRIIPVVSAALIVCIGLVMTGVSLGWIQPNRLAG
jgi:ABC-type nickel/cobalt efflux system permease component RcnA